MSEVVVVPETFAVSVSEKATLSVEVRDLDGNRLIDREVVWRSLNDEIAAVGSDGVVTGVRTGVVVVMASVDGVVGVSQATVRNRRDEGGDNDPEPPEEENGGNEGGEDAPSGKRPQGPSALEAERRGAKRVDVEWRDRSKDEDRFELHRRSTGGSWSLLARPNANAEGHRDRDVERDSGYQYRIRACNQKGCSDWVGPVSVGPHQDDEDDEEGDDDEEEDEEDNEDGSSQSASSPKGPGGLKAKAKKSERRVELKWKDRSDDERGFELQRQRDGQSWGDLARVDRDVDRYDDNGVQQGVQYNYRVRACNTHGCSAFSNIASARVS